MGDLLLAEATLQTTRGNFDRAAAALKVPKQSRDARRDVLETEVNMYRIVASSSTESGPRACSCATWSSINAISGLTTNVVPARAIPGSW